MIHLFASGLDTSMGQIADDLERVVADLRRFPDKLPYQELYLNLDKTKRPITKTYVRINKDHWYGAKPHEGVS